MKKLKMLVTFTLTAALVFSMASCATGSSKTTVSSSKTTVKKNIVIAFSNSYNGNSFRQDEETAFKQVADQLKSSGQISSYIISESNNNTSQQVSQIENFILKKVSLIMIDPASSSALDGAISKAKAAGIPVLIVNGGPVTSTDCYQLVDDQGAVTTATSNWLVKKLNGKGNVLILRGIAGTESDKDYYAAMMNVFNKYPGIKVVGSVYASWTDSISQSAVSTILPSLPKVDGIEGEGGDEYGAVQAFIAAGKPIPAVTGGNRGNYISWWADQIKADPTFTSYSNCVSPASASAGLYLAVDIVNGKKVPQNMVYPNVEITQAQLPSFVAQNMKATDLAMNLYSQSWVRSNLENQTSVDVSKYS